MKCEAGDLSDITKADALSSKGSSFAKSQALPPFSFANLLISGFSLNFESGWLSLDQVSKQHINELNLICTLSNRSDRSSRYRFSNNFISAKFAKFKKQLKLEANQLFPVNDKGSAYEQLSEHLRTVRRVNKHQYVAAGCSKNGFSAATVNAKTMAVEDKCVETGYTIHNIAAYNDILVVADSVHKIIVISIASQMKDCITLSDYKMSNMTESSNGLICGLNMDIDTHKPHTHMAYFMSDQNKLVRLNLKHINPLSPKATKEKLEIKEIYHSKTHGIFYVAYRNVYVMAGNMLTRINKFSLAAKEYNQKIECGKITRFVGDDEYIYAMSKATMYLLRVGQNTIISLDSIMSKIFISPQTRTLIPVSVW